MMILPILVLLLSLSGPCSSIASAGDGDGAAPSAAGCDLLLDGGWLVRSLAGPWLWLSCSSHTTTTTTTTTTATATTARKAPLLPASALLLEPIVTLRTGVLPPSACESLIALGEKASFPHEGESIDEYQDREYKVSSQSIEVYERKSESPPPPPPSSSSLAYLHRVCSIVRLSSRGSMHSSLSSLTYCMHASFS
jgi:hypothetical protein